jgi:hypothetical protein
MLFSSYDASDTYDEMFAQLKRVVRGVAPSCCSIDWDD